MRRRQVYAEIEQRKADAQMAVLAGTLDQVTAFDPSNYRMIVEATPSKPAPSLPAGPAAPAMRRRQLLPLQGDGPDGIPPSADLHVQPPFVLSASFMADPAHAGFEPDPYKTIRVDPGCCNKCGKHIGRGVGFHRARCKG